MTSIIKSNDDLKKCGKQINDIRVALLNELKEAFKSQESECEYAEMLSLYVET